MYSKIFITLLINLIFGSVVYATVNEPELAIDDVKPQIQSYPPKSISTPESFHSTEKSQPDWGPYMRELQRRIKMCWDPPKGLEINRVVLTFTVLKDGRLKDCKIIKSSGNPSADNAAILAVRLAAPFRPLPREYKGESVDVQFVFDYNVVGASIK